MHPDHPQVTTRRSDAWFKDPDMYGFVRRAYAKSMGLDDLDLSRPIIGIAQTYSELNNCSTHLRGLADAVKRGVWQAGGTPLEFPTVSLGELFIRPTTMLYRNLMAMDTEEMISAQPLDGVVALGNCDKTTPAQLMGAASADVPTICLTGGPTLSGRYEGKDFGACSDCRRYWADYRAGDVDDSTLAELEESINRSPGHCTVMGTASTMAALTEALGMALLGSAAIPAPDSRRLRIAEAVGRQIVSTIENDVRPRVVLTETAFRNAVSVLMALGGSTNAVIHLIAIARRCGVPLSMKLFDEISRRTPVLVDVRPTGTFHMEQFHEAGGVPYVLQLLGDRGLVDLRAMTVTGRSLQEELADRGGHGVAGNRPGWSGERCVIRSPETPLREEGGLVVLGGNLAPRGALIKQSAVSEALHRHRGQAIVFESVEDMRARIDDPDLDVVPDSVLVLRNVGPVGGPGMPEVGGIPIPRKLLATGVRDMVRISDARMSGTAYGAVVLHVTPESAIGGPLSLVRDGDWIELDIEARRLELDVPDRELASRKSSAEGQCQRSSPERGYKGLYVRHVLQADEGCDFDFL